MSNFGVEVITRLNSNYFLLLHFLESPILGQWLQNSTQTILFYYISKKDQFWCSGYKTQLKLFSSTAFLRKSNFGAAVVTKLNSNYSLLLYFLESPILVQWLQNSTQTILFNYIS